jgi:hypothetical protein
VYNTFHKCIIGLNGNIIQPKPPKLMPDPTSSQHNR